MNMKRTKPIYKTCPVCGEEFPVCPPGKSSRYYPRHSQVFCSKSCAYKARYRRGACCNKLSPTEAAYIAGFLDADGSILLYRRRQKAKLRLAFSNCKKAVLDWIQVCTGLGSLVSKKSKNPNARIGYTLFINSDAAESVLLQVEPYLIIKKPQAQLAIDFQQKLRLPQFASDAAWQNRVKAKMQLLNRRGVYPPSETVNL